MTKITKLEVFKKDELNVTTMDIESLKKEFGECLELTETCIRRMADIASELLRRGEELPKIDKTFLGKWIKKIAGGLLHERVFVKFCTNVHLLSKLENVPLKEQLSIADGTSKIPLAIIDEDGVIKTTNKLPTELSRKEIAIAFGDHGFRPIADQKKLLLRKSEIKKAKNRAKTLFIDPNTSILKLSNSFVRCSDGRKLKATDLIEVLSEYYKVDLEKLILKYAEKIIK